MSKRLSLLLVFLLAPLWAVPVFASEVFKVDREFYPYYPSLLKYPEPKAEFNSPDVCAECHSKQYEEWTASIHALAFEDPVYQGELNKAVHAVGHEITRQCEGCHTAAGVVTGEVKGTGLAGLSDMALAGVSCDVCHSVSATTHCQTPSHEPENGSLVLSPGVLKNGGMVLQKHGPNPSTELCGMGFHECIESPLHLQADLCASCHQVYHYEKHFPIESTYLEWKHGPYAQSNIHCQDCHMVDIETFKRTADRMIRPERHEYHHYFNGANYLLYYLTSEKYKKAGDGEGAANALQKYEMAVARLQSAAGMEIEPVYFENRLREVRVRVRNLRAGHNLPTSLTNIRQMWLEITARDASGQIILSSGRIDDKGHIEPHARIFNSDGMGDDFHFSLDPWIITAFSRHDTIPPKGHKDVYFGIAANEGDVTITARLRYRQADQKIAEKLLGAVPEDMDLNTIYGLTEVPELPVVDMLVKEITFPAGN
jgi:hypothetical protein